jgi:hypothetical protein
MLPELPLFCVGAWGPSPKFAVGHHPQTRPPLAATVYDFVVWSQRKRVEKLRCMHRNPVKRGLVLEPEADGPR